MKCPATLPQVWPYLHHQHQFHLCNDVLYYLIEKGEGKHDWMQLVLPDAFQLTALQFCHYQLGHHGVNRTLTLLKDHFFWPQMETDV